MSEADVVPTASRPSPERLVELLSAAPFFAELEPSLIHEIARSIEWRAVPGGSVLMTQGEPARALYLLISGRMVVTVRDGDGPETVVGEVAARETIGEMGVLADRPRTATVRAIRDCELMRLSREAFRALAETHHALMMRVTRLVIERLAPLAPSRVRSTVKTIAVIPASPSVDDRAAEAIAAALRTQRTVELVHADRVSREVGPGAASAGSGDAMQHELQRWLARCESESDLVVYAAEQGATPWSRRCLRQADRVVIVVDAADPAATSAIEQDGLTRSGVPGLRFDLVVLHGDEREPTETAELLKAHAVAAHHHVRLSVAGDMARLARQLTGAAVGLVLGGGGARGLAHIGILKAMDAAGVPIDMIGGTSIGAIIGAQRAMGWDAVTATEQFKRYMREGKPTRDVTVPYAGVLSGKRAGRLMNQMFGDRWIEDLWLNYFCVSTNLTQARVVEHDSGPLWRAIRTSTSMPGVFTPMYENGDVLVDGAVLNNVPGDIMRRRNRGLVVTVDVNPATDLRVDTALTECPSPWQLILRRIGLSRAPLVPTIPEVLMRAGQLGSLAHSSDVMRSSDLHIAPEVGGWATFQWDAIDAIIAAGYEAASRSLEGWGDAPSSPVVD